MGLLFECGGVSQEFQVGRLNNVIRGSSGGSQKRKGSPLFAHPKKFAKLGEDVGMANSGMAALHVTAISNSWESISSSRGGEDNAGSLRQLVVIGDSKGLFKGTNKLICHWDHLNRMVCFLPGARICYAVDWVD